METSGVTQDYTKSYFQVKRATLIFGPGIEVLQVKQSSLCMSSNFMLNLPLQNNNYTTVKPF